ncbi:MAG TPA: hypothetical protein VGW12_06665 [Pyrinomonadaceae bacterium]|nr:hypothetical protein [Pyrinomonadaceae bacterium]
MNKILTVCVVALSLAGCREARALRPEDSAAHVNVKPSPKVALSDINLASIGRIAPKGRVQDKEDNQLPVVDQLLEHGKEAIPFLISRLEDETEIEKRVLDYWSEVRVGDVALVILTDFFTDKSWERTTIPGVGWDEFLGGKHDGSVTGEDRLRDYVDSRGRKEIKERWLRIWEKHKENIIWDDEERCFVTQNAN